MQSLQRDPYGMHAGCATHLMIAGVEELLVETIEAAKRAQVIESTSLTRVIVDTTVDGQGDRAFDRFASACAPSGASGEGGRPAWSEAAAELQPRGVASREPDRPLRACEAIQADEEGAADIAFARRPRDARFRKVTRWRRTRNALGTGRTDRPHEADPVAVA